MLEIFLFYFLGYVIAFLLLFIVNKFFDAVITFNEALNFSLLSWGTVLLLIVVLIVAMFQTLLYKVISTSKFYNYWQQLEERYTKFVNNQDRWFR